MRIIKGALLRYNYVLYTTTTHLWWFSRPHKIMQVAKPWKSSLNSTLQVMDIVCVFSFAELKIRTRFPRWKKCRCSSPSLSCVSFSLPLSLCLSLSRSLPLCLSLSISVSLSLTDMSAYLSLGARALPCNCRANIAEVISNSIDGNILCFHKLQQFFAPCPSLLCKMQWTK